MTELGGGGGCSLPPPPLAPGQRRAHRAARLSYAAAAGCCRRPPGRLGGRGDRRSGLAPRRGGRHASCQAAQLIERAITSLGGGGARPGWAGWRVGGRAAAGRSQQLAGGPAIAAGSMPQAGGCRIRNCAGGHVARHGHGPGYSPLPRCCPVCMAPGSMPIAQTGWSIGVWHSRAGRRRCSWRRRRQCASAAPADPSCAHRGRAALTSPRTHVLLY